MGRNSATIAWSLCAVAITAAVGLGILVFNERRANDAELARLDEARASLRREESRSRELADQMAALRQQLSALGDRVSGLEQSNRDLEKRLANARRTALPADVTAPGLPSGPVAPDVAFVDLLPSVELHLIGEPAAPLASLNLAPTNEWPVAARIPIPRETSFLARPQTMKRMYLTYAALQATDVATTLAGLERGGYEANPMMRGVANKPSALIAVKVGSSVATYLLIEKLRKDKPMTAAIALAALNSTLAVITANNMRAAAAVKKQ